MSETRSLANTIVTLVGVALIAAAVVHATGTGAARYLLLGLVLAGAAFALAPGEGRPQAIPVRVSRPRPNSWNRPR